jgi:hypothetical protein
MGVRRGGGGAARTVRSVSGTPTVGDGIRALQDVLPRT